MNGEPSTSEKHMNIIDVIWRNSYAWPEQPAILIGGKVLTYQDFRQMTELVSARLAQTGVRRGDCVAVALRSPPAYLALIFAIARLGAVATPFKMQWTELHKQTLLTRHAVRFLVHERGEPWRSTLLAPEHHLSVQTLIRLPVAGENIQLPALAADVDDAPWMIAVTSGTTGVPKSVVKTHWAGAMAASLQSGSQVDQRLTRLLVFASLDIQLGIGAMLRQLYAGGTLVLTPSLHPAEFFRVVERDRPTRATTTTGIAARLVAHAAGHLPDSASRCSSLESITLSGSAVPPAVRQGVTQRICPQLEINYGSTEAGSIASMSTDMLTSHPASAGRLFSWVHAQVVDENDQPMAGGQAGTLRFKTSMMASGYLQDDEASARSFRSGWFYPGDKGLVDAAGYLSLTGRVDDVLNLGGNKIDPVRIEKVLQSYPAVFEAAVTIATGSDGRTMLVALVIAEAALDTAQLRQWCAEWLRPQEVPNHIAVVKTLPKNAGGKLMRDALARRVQFSPAKAVPDA